MDKFELGLTLNRIALTLPDHYYAKIKEDMKKIEAELIRLYDIEDAVKELVRRYTDDGK